MKTSSAPRAWSLHDPAAAQDLRDWIAEAHLDLEPLRALPRGRRMTLTLQRVERERAAPLRAGWLRLLHGERIPVLRWNVSIDGATGAALEIDPSEAELVVRDLSAESSRITIRGVSGRFEVRGTRLRVRAVPQGESDLEAVRVLCFDWFRSRANGRA